MRSPAHTLRLLRKDVILKRIESYAFQDQIQNPTCNSSNPNSSIPRCFWPSETLSTVVIVSPPRSSSFDRVFLSHFSGHPGPVSSFLCLRTRRRWPAEAPICFKWLEVTIRTAQRGTVQRLLVELNHSNPIQHQKNFLRPTTLWAEE